MTTQHVEARSRIWDDWDVPRDQLLRGFAAAAALYREAPWLMISKFKRVRAILPGGGRWTLVIAGPASDCRVFACPEYEDGRALDAEDVYGDEEDEDPCLTLSFGTLERMPEDARQGIRELKGQVAGPEAYPWFRDTGDADRSLTLGDLEEVITVVEAVPRYLKARHRLLTAEGVVARRRNVLSQVRWTDESSGVQFEDVISDVSGDSDSEG